MTGIALWTGGLALTPFLRPGGSSTVPSRWKRGRLQVVYVGANDCAPCLRWRREKRPAFERYASRLAERPAAKRAKALDDALKPMPGG